MKFKFTGPVDPQTGQAPGVYILTDQIGSLDPALECIFEHHFATPGLYKSMDMAMQLVQGSCECHLDGPDVRRAPRVGGGGNGNGAGAGGVGAGVAVGVNVHNEDVLEEDEVFGTAALLLFRADLRHPLVQPNSLLDALLNSTRGTVLSGDRQLRYGRECVRCPGGCLFHILAYQLFLVYRGDERSKEADNHTKGRRKYYTSLLFFVSRSFGGDAPCDADAGRCWVGGICSWAHVSTAALC